jgi:tRNA 2-thiouridine synthesizing protein A
MTTRDCQTILDLSGLLCPLPVLKARKKLAAMASGEVLQVIATDPMTVIDFPHFCNEEGHHLLDQQRQGEAFVFRIERR